jgi:hypothetical protein
MARPGRWVLALLLAGFSAGAGSDRPLQSRTGDGRGVVTPRPCEPTPSCSSPSLPS